MLVSLSRRTLRHQCWSGPVPERFLRAAASLRPRVKHALRKIAEYNSRHHACLRLPALHAVIRGLDPDDMAAGQSRMLRIFNP